MKDGKHGFHIHEYGDLSDGYTSACAHSIHSIKHTVV